MFKINKKLASNKQIIGMIADIVQDKQLSNLFNTNFKQFINEIKDADDVNNYLKSNISKNNYENIGGIY